MKKLLLTIALTMSAALSVSASVNAHFLTGNDLLTRLNTPGERVIGQAYIVGVFDSYSGVTHCAPESVTVSQITDMVKEYLITNAAIRHRSADVLVAAMLNSVWACPKKTTPSSFL